MVGKEEFEELRSKLATYEAQQKVSQTQMKEEVKEQVGEVAVGLKELYTQASAAVGKLDVRVEKLEAKGGNGQMSLLHYKNMTISVLDKMDQWRSWKSNVEDYTEETLPGIRGYLEKAKESDEEIEEVDVDPVAWEQREMLWRFLKK